MGKEEEEEGLRKSDCPECLVDCIQNTTEPGQNIPALNKYDVLNALLTRNNTGIVLISLILEELRDKITAFSY